MDAIDLIPAGRYPSRIISVQVRHDYNATAYSVIVYGKILAGGHWMDVLRPAHPTPAIEKMDRRKPEELLKATGVETPEQVKGREVTALLSIRKFKDGQAENSITGYRAVEVANQELVADTTGP